MARTTVAAVRALLAPGKDYDTENEPSLARFIESAGVIVSRVRACATNKGITLTSAELELMECWLAAYLYTRSDPIYASKSTEGASASFVSDPVDPERYRMGAISVDYSGCLAAILKGQRAGVAWLGKSPSEQIPYVDRD